MKNFILSAAVIAFAGVSVSQAGMVKSNLSLTQDTVQKDTVTTPTDSVPSDTTKKSELYDVTAYAASAAQDTTTESTSPAQAEQPASAPATETQRKAVEMNTLPEPVKQTLSADIFKEWVPSAAYDVTEGTNQYYQIEVKKGEEVRSVKIGADGKVVNE